MCVIIYSQIKNLQHLSQAEYKIAWNNNPHGAGFVVHNKKDILLIKRTMSPKEYLKILNQIKTFDGNNIIIIHLRLATHGKISIENTHPHVFGNFMVIHNGIFRVYQDKNPSLEKSDTYWKGENFYTEILRNNRTLDDIPDEFIKNYFETTAALNKVILLQKTKKGIIEKIYNLYEYKKGILVSNYYSFRDPIEFDYDDYYYKKFKKHK